MALKLLFKKKGFGIHSSVGERYYLRYCTKNAQACPSEQINAKPEVLWHCSLQS